LTVCLAVDESFFYKDQSFAQDIYFVCFGEEVLQVNKKSAGNGQTQMIMETMDAGSVYVWAVRLRGDC
jgi:hypothetical protein